MFSESYFLRRPAAQFVPVNGLCKQDSCIFAAANLHFPLHSAHATKYIWKLYCIFPTNKNQIPKFFYKITTKSCWQISDDMLSYNQTEGNLNEANKNRTRRKLRHRPAGRGIQELSIKENLFYIQEIGGTVRWNELCRTYWTVCRSGFRTVCKQILPIIENCRKPGSIMK